MWRIVIWTVLWVGFAPGFALGLARLEAQAGCGGAGAAAALVHARQTDVSKVRVPELSTEVPAALREQITALKEAAAGAVEAGMQCVPAAADAPVLQGSLAKLLGANLAETASGPNVGAYGAGLKVTVSTPANAAGLRGVQVSFGIECGADTMLLLYAAEAQGWRRVLRWQSREYAEVSGAFGDFFAYAVVPDAGGDAGGMRVAVAHGTPWCTSRFSGVKMDVLAAVAGGGAARVVWHREASYSRGDTPARMRATGDGFELRVNAPAMDLTQYERGVIYRYKMSRDEVLRVEPIALNGRGFVEEWMSMPWDEAKAQTAVEAVAGMKVLHDRLMQKDKAASTYVSYTYGPVRGCLVKGRYEVEMDADPGGPEFYAIEERPGGYAMVNFGTTQDERCSGRDVMKK